MEQTPFSEASGHLASQEIFRLLWKLKVCYRVRRARHWSLSSDESNSHLPTLFPKDPFTLSIFHTIT